MLFLLQTKEAKMPINHEEEINNCQDCIYVSVILGYMNFILRLQCNLNSGSAVQEHFRHPGVLQFI